MDIHEMESLVKLCTYKPGWTIHFQIDGKDSRPYIQIEVDETSDASLSSVSRDGARQGWKSGKRYLSEFMCRQEVVGTVLGLIKDAEMHEILEWFRYKGASIYNPHLDPDALVDVARKLKNFNVRENAMTMIERD